MPWVRDDADGLQVPGLYQALLERECERQERADRRVTYATAGVPADAPRSSSAGHVGGGEARRRPHWPARRLGCAEGAAH